MLITSPEAVESYIILFILKAQVGVPTRIYNIFLTILEPEKRNYPMVVSVLTSAKVQDLIGLICWKLSLENGQQNLK